jgi:putative transposase
MKTQGTVIPIDDTVDQPSDPHVIVSPLVQPTLDEIVREGARKLLQQAIEAEVADVLERNHHLVDEQSRRLVVGNGSMPERTILTGAGPLTIRQPRIDDRRARGRGYKRFKSAILPRYARRSDSIASLLTALYLRGVSTGSFSQALEALLGSNAAGLSATTITRLLEQWQQEYKQFTERDLSSKQFVYFWADGIYFNVRLTDERPCLLVIIGGTADGRKEIVAIADGERESKLSWKEVLLQLKEHGLQQAPQLAVADGALGFWPALEEVFPSTRHQRCWVHKTVNILDKMPKKLQPAAKHQIQQIYTASTKAEALSEARTFVNLYQAKQPAACQCLQRDLDQLLSFYDFPIEHWRHLRTTNIIESTFATVRHRTRQTKGNGSRQATLAMAYKLAAEAEKSWQRLDGQAMFKVLAAGVRFADGLPIQNDQLKSAA